MLYSVRGKLIAIESNAAVVECGGVGYMCQTTMNTLKAVKLNTEVTLYTYLNVREDAVDLSALQQRQSLKPLKPHQRKRCRSKGRTCGFVGAQSRTGCNGDCLR